MSGLLLLNRGADVPVQRDEFTIDSTSRRDLRSRDEGLEFPYELNRPGFRGGPLA